MIEKYVKVFRVGDRNVKNVFDGQVTVEEKLDGSQFRIYVKDGELTFGSHRVNFDDEHQPDKMFNKAIISAKEHFKDLHGEYMIYCEFISKPRHNTLSYEKTPRGFLIIFDVLNVEINRFLNYDEKKAFGESVYLDVPQLIYEGEGSNITTDMLEEWANKTTSMLGLQIVEGVVIKNYSRTHEMECFLGFPLISKFVRSTFTEMNHENWKDKKMGVMEKLSIKYKTVARWDKSIQRLKEEGKLTGEMSDLQYLIPEVSNDILSEEGEEIKKELLNHFIKNLRKSWTGGFAEYYQKVLMKKALEEEE